MANFMKVLLLAGLLYLASSDLSEAQENVTSPMEEFGHQIGDDYRLINYTQFEAYIKKLENESLRVKLETMGQTAEGRTQWMTIITSPENHTNLDRYKSISTRLAHAEGVSELEARGLAEEGKAVGGEVRIFTFSQEFMRPCSTSGKTVLCTNILLGSIQT